MIFIKILINAVQKKCKILIVLDAMSTDTLSNKTFSPIVTELFITGWKLKLYLVFITQSCFSVPKNISLNSKPCFIIKFPNIQKFQQITCGYSSNINFQGFINLYKKCNANMF